MKPFNAMGKLGIGLLLLNEVRGVFVVLSVLSAWSHADKAAAPEPASACGSAPQSTWDTACGSVRTAKSPKLAATAQPNGRSGAIAGPPMRQ